MTKTVSRILDELQKRKFLIQRNDGEGDQDTTAKPMDNRGRVVQELVDTERKYVQDLEALQDYMKTLQASEVAPPDLIHNMFLNLNSLVDFQRRFLIRVETVYAQPPEQQRWGQVMVSHVGTPGHCKFHDLTAYRKIPLMSTNLIVPTSTVHRPWQCKRQGDWPK